MSLGKIVNFLNKKNYIVNYAQKYRFFFLLIVYVDISKYISNSFEIGLKKIGQASISESYELLTKPLAPVSTPPRVSANQLTKKYSMLKYFDREKKYMQKNAMVMKRTAKAWARLVRKVSRKYPLKNIYYINIQFPNLNTYTFNMTS